MSEEFKMGREEEIRIIAYRIWEEDGYCHGRDIEHWLRAEVIWEEKNKPQKATTEIKTAQQGIVHKEKKSKGKIKK